MLKITLRLIMKKKFFIIAIFAISIFLLGIFLIQLRTFKNRISNTQTEKLSTGQNLNENTISNISPYTENVLVSQVSTKDVRNMEIQNRIEKYGKNENGIPVLMYHFFYDSSAGGKGSDNNFLDISKFEEQLKYLKDNDFFFPTFTELSDFIAGKIDQPKKSVILTIDDGNVTFFALAIPIIEKYEVPVTSFAITSNCDSSTITQYESDYVHFESHSHNLHQAGQNGKGLLVNISYEKAYADIEQSISIVNSKDAFCYPFGHYNNTAIQVLKDIGYKLAFTTKGGKVQKGMNPFELPRVRILRDDSISSFIAKVKN